MVLGIDLKQTKSGKALALTSDRLDSKKELAGGHIIVGGGAWALIM